MPEEEVKGKTTKTENTDKKKFRYYPTQDGTTMAQITSSKVKVKMHTVII